MRLRRRSRSARARRGALVGPPWITPREGASEDDPSTRFFCACGSTARRRPNSRLAPRQPSWWRSIARNVRAPVAPSGGTRPGERARCPRASRRRSTRRSKTAAVPPGVGAAGGRRLGVQRVRRAIGRPPPLPAAASSVGSVGFTTSEKNWTPRRCRRVRDPRRPSSARAALIAPLSVGGAPTAAATLPPRRPVPRRRRRRRPSRRRRRRRRRRMLHSATPPRLLLYNEKPLALLRAVYDLRPAERRGRGDAAATAATRVAVRRYRRLRGGGVSFGDYLDRRSACTGEPPQQRGSTQVSSVSPIARGAMPSTSRHSSTLAVRAAGATQPTRRPRARAVVLVVGKGAERPRARRRAPRRAASAGRAALLSPLKAFRTLQSSALDALSAYFSRRFHDEGGVVYRAGEPADRLFLVAEGSVAVLPADAVPPDDDDGGGGSPRQAWSPASADSGRGRRFSLRRRAARAPPRSRPTAPRRRGSAAPPRCSRLPPPSGTARRRARRALGACCVELRERGGSRSPTADADAVHQIAPQLLAEWQEQTKRAAGVRQFLERRGGAGGRDRGDATAAAAGVRAV